MRGIVVNSGKIADIIIIIKLYRYITVGTKIDHNLKYERWNTSPGSSVGSSLALLKLHKEMDNYGSWRLERTNLHVL